MAENDSNVNSGVALSDSELKVTYEKTQDQAQNNCAVSFFFYSF